MVHFCTCVCEWRIGREGRRREGGREGRRREGGREGRREGGREQAREGGRIGGREGAREGGRIGGGKEDRRKGGRIGGKVGGEGGRRREGGGGREQPIDTSSHLLVTYTGSIDWSQTVEENVICHIFRREGSIRQLPSRHST